MAKIVPMPPEEPHLTTVERIVRADLAARRAVRRELWELERKAQGNALPGVDPLASYVDPGLMHALGIVRQRRRKGGVS
jgi:hypothetical protein